MMQELKHDLYEHNNCQVVDYQPSLYGVGLYQFSGPTAVNALIRHGEYNINANTTVRFIPVDRAINHRAEQGFRKGWLMFVGMHQTIETILTLPMLYPPLGSSCIGIIQTQFQRESWFMLPFLHLLWFLEMWFLVDLLLWEE
jgi:hypothetical protein